MTVRKGPTWLALLAALLAGCRATPSAPLATVPHVDLQRFMGDWYVIASIPTYIERDAHNAIESYRLADDGRIATTFRFRTGGFNGPEKVYRPTGFVRNRDSNAIWGMQFIWPVKADYRIVYLSPDYGQTVIGRQARDYVWIMARTPAIPAADYASILELLQRQGYDIGRVQKVPQRWPPAGEQP
jgi:apolipoprotein D and lipocalin family protein